MKLEISKRAADKSSLHNASHMRSLAVFILIPILCIKTVGGLGGWAPPLPLFTSSCRAGAQDLVSPRASCSLRRSNAEADREFHHIMRLRGGLWYDPEKEVTDDEEWEENEESYYESTEDAADAFDQQALGGVLSQMHKQEFVLPDGRKIEVDSDLPTRMGDGMTLEQARADERFLPGIGKFHGGCDPSIAEAVLARMRHGWIDGSPPQQDLVPLRLYDVYGLSEYVKCEDEDNAERGRPFETEIDSPNDEPRNLLKIPPHELPDFFHMPCGEDPSHGAEPMTMAKRFGNWTGPAPQVFSGYVRTPKGRILVHSYPQHTLDKEADELLNVTDDFGQPLIASREALAFFQACSKPASTQTKPMPLA